MHFDFTEKVKTLQKRLQSFMDEHIYPNEHRHHTELDPNDRWKPSRIIEELKPKARAGKRGRGWVNESGIRAAVRDHGPFHHGGGGIQLLRAGHGQHGSVGALWLA